MAHPNLADAAPQSPHLALAREFGAGATVDNDTNKTADVTLLGSWAFTANDLALGVDMIERTRIASPGATSRRSIRSRSTACRKRLPTPWP